MNLLAIDTSTERATVALAVGNEILSETQPSLRQHAQVLLPMVERLLALSSISLNQLDGVVFGQGPGSFTGIRIACSITKGLAYAHDLPVYSVSGLAAIAWELQESLLVDSQTHILAVIDARMKELYWGCFRPNTFSCIESVSPPGSIVPSISGSLILAGVGYESSEFSSSLQQQIVMQRSVYPNAKSMLKIVRSGCVNASNAEDAMPVYIRNKVTQGEPNG